MGKWHGVVSGMALGLVIGIIYFFPGQSARQYSSPMHERVRPDTPPMPAILFLIAGGGVAGYFAEFGLSGLAKWPRKKRN